MAKAIRRTANALSAEGDLLNVYAELKDVVREFEATAKAREMAVEALLNWGDRKARVNGRAGLWRARARPWRPDRGVVFFYFF